MLRVIKNSATERKVYTGPHQQLAFHACWSPYLINPVLNRLYKDSVCYTERWYLEVRRMINEGMWTHPLLVSVIKDPALKTQIVKSTFIDGALMRNVLNDDTLPEFQISASVNLKKLNRWCAFFVSLPDSLKTLADLNDQSRD